MRRLTNQEFIDRAIKIHGNLYDYKKTFYCHSHVKVCVVCPKHGDFWQIPSDHLNGRRCKYCGLERQTNLKSTTKNFVDKARHVHGDKYNYEKVIYVGAHDKVCVRCPKHGDFWQTPNHHVKGRGCPECGAEVRKACRLLRLEEILFRFRKVHGNRYDYAKVKYEGAHGKICVGCKKHGKFWQIAQDHWYGHGCPMCGDESSALSSVSVSSEEWLAHLERSSGYAIQRHSHGGEFIIPTTRLRADGYCLETNTVYEFYGDYWHGNPAVYQPETVIKLPKQKSKTAAQLYETTLAREAKIRSLGYNLVTIWEADWKRQTNTSTV